MCDYVFQLILAFPVTQLPLCCMPCYDCRPAGSNNYERYKAWFNLPSLLGLTLNSPTISTTTLNLSEHSMANELHALVHAAKCLALAQQQAANRVLTCGSRFLHPEADDQAAGMLACFAKVAATTLYIRWVINVDCSTWRLPLLCQLAALQHFCFRCCDHTAV
jgi:hypothetical protein